MAGKKMKRVSGIIHRFVENGRILDDEKVALKTALLEVAKTGKANFRFTANQNVILSDIDAKR